MKVQLKEQQGYQVLSVDGPIDIHNFQVMKAGISKLFKDGKNKIILELVWNKELDDGIIREFGALNGLARELSGELMLVVSDALLRTKIENFAKPNIIKCYENKLKAIEAVSAQKLGAQPSKGMEERDAEIKALKEQLRAKEMGELQQVKAKNAELATENAKFEEILSKMHIERRHPSDEKAYQEKIKTLEDEMLVMSQKLTDLQNPANANKPK